MKRAMVKVGAGVLAMAALVGCVGREPRTPLARAAARGDLAEVKVQLGQGADPAAMDGSGLTPLMWAARVGSVETIRVFLAAGAPIDERDRAVSGWTALVHAIHKGQNGAAVALLEAGADPNLRCDGETTALMYAAAYGNAPIVAALLDRGADPRAKSSGGVTALSNASGGGGRFDFTDGPAIGTRHEEVIRLLLEKAPDLRATADLR